MQRADMAMYVAKGTRSGSEVYDATGMRPDPLAVVGDLRRGLSDGELGVLYQPKVDLLTGEVRGAEALVRWEHPLRGLVLPSQLRRARRAHRPHPPAHAARARHRARPGRASGDRAGLDMTVAVNVSMRSLLDRGAARGRRGAAEEVGRPGLARSPSS